MYRVFQMETHQSNQDIFMSQNFCLDYLATIRMSTLFSFHYVLMDHSVLYVLMFRESRLKVLKKYVFPIQTP